MPMKPSHPLQQEVDRRNIGDHDVEIDIQRLLDYLSSHNDEPMRAFALIGAKQTQELSIVRHPVHSDET